MNLWKRRNPEKRAERRRKALAVLGLYLDDLLLVSGGVCLVAAAALRWGAAAGLATTGGCLVLFSVLVARAGRR
nr:hypothetical protein [uncultured Oscillibacter sp.]